MNDYEVVGEFAYIVINSPKYGNFKVKIDIEDIEKCRKVRWCVGKIYHAENLFYTRGKFKEKTVLLHRYIMNAEIKSVVVDHIDGNTLNNRRCNLRIVTPTQNSINRSHKNNLTVSKHRGVAWYPYRGMNKWMAHIKLNGKLKNLGYFDELEDAIDARLEAEKEMFGEYARAD